MGERIRNFDWASTPLGPMDRWSPTLRMTTRFVLANGFPLLLWWGPQYVSIYNDAYQPILGTKHPWALGRPVHECWSEIWNVLRPLIDTPFHGGPATWNEDLCVEIHRKGFLEETHFTIAYSPVPDDAAAGGIGGVLANVHEITEKIIGERRVLALRDLGAAVAQARTAEEACVSALQTLGTHAKDVPFALAYLIDLDRKRLRLAAAVGVADDSPLRSAVIELTDPTSPWPLAEVMEQEALCIVDDLAGRFGEAVPAGPWSDRPRQAVVVPIRSNVPGQSAGVLVLGVSARLRLDDLYRSFHELVAGQIATGVANARAYDEERKRAEALAELDRAKTTFFSNVSHEFRTPLTLMLGPLEEALANAHGILPLGASKDLAIAHRNCLRLLRLVNTLLDFSRIEAGRIDARFEPTDLAAFTTNLAGVFQAAIEKAGLRLVVDCPPLPEPVYVDGEMWEKIVLNLLSNAFKFTFKGEIRVTLRWLGDRVELQVIDTGVGIPSSVLPMIFERFHQVKNARARTHEGTGIGLTLVQELARLHGGEVTVRSEEGQGSTFSVVVQTGRNHLPPGRIQRRLPGGSPSLGAAPFVEEALRWLPEESESEVPSAGDARPSPRPRSTASPDVAGARILIADDNADMREYLRRLLARSYEVELVADGQDALERIQANPPELVLADVMMPRLDGFDLISRLRSEGRTRSIPIILLSARAGEEARVEGMAAGADDYLTKPFSARELAARIEAHLKLTRLRREANQSLRESEERLQIAKAAARLGIHDYNVATGEIRWDERVRQLWGVSPDQPITYDVFVGGLHPDDRGPTEAELARALDPAGGGRFFAEYRVLHRADRLARWVAATGQVSFDQGRAVRLVGTVQDITAGKEAERELADRAVQLEKLVQERTTKLQEMVNELQHISCATVHDMRAPLRAMNEFVELMCQAQATREQTKDYGRRLRLAANRLDQLIQDSLRYSKLAHQEFVRRPVDLSTLMRGLIETYPHLQADRADIQIEGRLPVVLGDEAALTQCFTNLLSNAVKFVKPGTRPRVRVSSEMKEGAVRIWVKDNGIGIAPQAQRRLFKMFQPLADNPEGTGIGLAIVRKVVERMNGRVGVDSRPGRGSRFWVELPLSEDGSRA